MTSASKPFIVAVPMTNAEGTDWNDDVHVYPKNEGLNPEKKPNKPSVNIGDEVKWTIKANVPSDFNTYKKFQIVDQLDKRLNYVDNTVVVYGSDTAETPLSKVILDKSSDNGNTGDYVIIHAPASDSDKEKVTIQLTETGIKKLADESSVTKIVVEFGTTVNGNISNDIDNIIKNDATINFENESGSDGVTTPEAEVDTGEIKIDKKDSNDDKPLKGSEFQIASFNEHAASEEYLKVKLDSNNKIIAILEKGDTGYDDAYSWVVRPHAEGSELVVDKTKKIFYATSFGGLQTHDSSNNWSSYWVVETKAPKDYNLLEAPVQITFESGLTNYVLTKPVINKKGFTLPNTGGIGTMFLVVFGIILIGLAIILIMGKNRKTV
ncbi:SpaH/EbpB family LPXTG-anchored major pilin [Enterococcus pseudoavium]|uniref:SpaH/EbpB family LPXTG-anchored major pilin n=1 Tax=Enterococcus pseudoavium TaxID=44007 RepID=A0ABU3FJ10_9ENTE|nr:SpaH/EbpB family LPXTG-anchored major pilin [Enterococcus pseudoavium]